LAGPDFLAPPDVLPAPDALPAPDFLAAPDVLAGDLFAGAFRAPAEALAELVRARRVVGGHYQHVVLLAGHLGVLPRMGEGTHAFAPGA